MIADVGAATIACLGTTLTAHVSTTMTVLALLLRQPSGASA